MKIMSKTASQYTNVINSCRLIFEKKSVDYGTSWRILRPSSLTDQIFIKAQRIRTIQETGENKVGESVEDAFQAIVNYCIMAIIQLRYPTDYNDNLSPEIALKYYNEIENEAFELMERKNHDYGEAWRDMRVSSLTDLILTKVLRIKQIEDNQGKTLASEGVEGNYFDMLNYSIFALIHLNGDC
jgi:carboxylesterase type B